MTKPSPLHFKISSSLQLIDLQEWNHVFPPALKGYRFFKVVEESFRSIIPAEGSLAGDEPSTPYEFYYLSIYSDQKLVCLLPCFIMEYALETTVQGGLKRFLSWLGRKIPGLLRWRVVMGGTPPSEGKIGFDRSVPSELSEVLWDGLSCLAQSQHAQVIAFKHFSQDYTEVLDPLTRKGFHKVRGFPSVELNICFKTFEEYLASLSRSTRRSLRRKFKKISGKPKIELEVRSDPDELLPEIYQLYLQTFNKSDVQFEMPPPEFFSRVAAALPDESKFFLWRLQGKLVAFDFCLVSRDRLIDEYLGMDYTVAYDYHLYFLTFRDLLQWCLEHGIHTYESGPLNYEPKKHLDFAFIPQYIYVQHRNPLLNLLLAPFIPLLNPEHFDPILKSFREEHPYQAGESQPCPDKTSKP